VDGLALVAGLTWCTSSADPALAGDAPKDEPTTERIDPGHQAVHVVRIRRLEGSIQARDPAFRPPDRSWVQMVQTRGHAGRLSG
jgi:hypothetical protein